MSIERPSAHDEPDFMRGDAKTMARLAVLTESMDNLQMLLEALEEARGWAVYAKLYLYGDLAGMLAQVKLAIGRVRDEIEEIKNG